MKSDGVFFDTPCIFTTVDVLGDLVVSSEPEEFNESSSGVLTCAVTFGGPPNVDLPDFPRLELRLGGSVINQERAPINYTYQAPMHYMVRVCLSSTATCDILLQACTKCGPWWACVARRGLKEVTIICGP